MTLKDLVQKLMSKPEFKAGTEVEFFVYRKSDGAMITAELSGPATMDLMKVMAKHSPTKQTKSPRG